MLRVWLGSLVLGTVFAVGPAQGATFTVDRTDDLPDSNVGSGGCSVGGGADKCTLRAAIEEANFTAGADIIDFNIGGGGAQTIVLTSALPAIAHPVTINGWSQGGVTYTGPPLIEIDATASADVLQLLNGSSPSTIRGLCINRSSGAAILIWSSSSNTIVGNYLGTNLAGNSTAGLGNLVGINILDDSDSNTIGGAAATDRNIISGNTVDGIQVNGGGVGASSNVIQGNYIGTDVTGNNDLGNTNQGISNFNASWGTRIIDNVISGNNERGIGLSGAAVTGVVVQGNEIGTNAAGTLELHNNLSGINVEAGAAGNTIGGTAAGEGNVIAFNNAANSPGSGGILLLASAGNGNAILGNSIYSNTGLGIDLGEDGVTSNDIGDGDSGPNNRQSFPVLTAAMTNGLGTFANVAGTLDSAASTTYRIEFFASTAADPTGFGEGQRYLGFTSVTTDAAGHAIIGVTLATALTAGEYVTATATDPANNTSELGGDVVAVGHLVVTTTADTVDGDTSSVSNLIANPGGGLISLREAITATNALPASTDTITFGIPIADTGHVYYQDNGIGGFGAPTQTTLADLSTPSSPTISNYDVNYPAGTARSWYRITLGSPLPPITDAIILDSTTQPLSVAGTGPVIEVNGAAGGNELLDLQAGASGSTIRGFVINSGTSHAIRIRASSNNVIAGNFLGTNPAGTAPGPGNHTCIHIVAATGVANGNRVGGTDVADRNVISGNTLDGIQLDGTSGGGTANNVIQGNYIGTDVTGALPVPNQGQGISEFGTNTNNVIGGTVAGAGNVISGNNGHGIHIHEVGATGTLIRGNKIGTNAAGTAGIPNGLAGVRLYNATSNNTVGGTEPGAGNVIAYNGGVGVLLRSTAGNGNAILGNSIHSNGSLGIDLNEDGVPANDSLDADSGPNDLLNFPQVTSASPSGGTVTVWFKLDAPAGSYRVELFKNPSGVDPSENGEGEVYAGSTNVNHLGGGPRFFNASFPGNSGDVITATATACTDAPLCAAFGSTSELSNQVTAFTTAVTLMSFTAMPADRAVDLAWQTGSELDNLGFHLHRALSESGPWTRITPSLIPGLGSSPVGASYSWHDGGLTNGVRYHYRLEDVDLSSVSTFHGPVSAVPSAPGEDGGDDGGADGTERDGSCPSWVLAAAPDALSPTCTRHGDPEATSLQILSRDASSATLELHTGGFWALHEGVSGVLVGERGVAETVRVFVPGLELPADPGAPALPLRRALVEAVVGKQVELVSAEALDQQFFRGLRPSAVGVAEMAVGMDGTVRPARRALGAPPLSRGYVPKEVARLAGTVFQGDRKSAVVEITPVHYAGRGLVIARTVVVRLAFTGTAEEGGGTGSRGRSLPRRMGVRDVIAQLHTSRRGLYAVRFEQLFPHGGRGLSTALLRLQRQGEAVAFHVEPAGPVFGPGSVLYFFADRTALSTDYSSEVAYELVRSTGVQMGSAWAAPQGSPLGSPSMGFASFETNRIYQPGLLEAKDVWLWQAAASGVAAPPRVSFGLSGVVTSEPARLVVHLQGGSASGRDVDHHVRFVLNGVELGETTFAGKLPNEADLPVPASVLVEGENALAIVNVGDTGVTSLVLLDRFEVSYPQASTGRHGLFEGTWGEGGTVEVAGLSGPPVILSFRAVTADPSSRDTDGAPRDASDSAIGVPRTDSTVRRVTGYQSTPGSVRFQAEAGQRYLVVSPEGVLSPRIEWPSLSTLRAPDNQADYLVIAPRAFLEAAEPLLERRRGQGLSSRTVVFEQIASEFGQGQPSADAIRSFLSYAYHSWQRPSPRYVLLLGDSTVDPQRFVATSGPSPLPALLTKTTYLWTVSDPALGAVNGEDLVPDLAIGRLPAGTVEEAQRLVSKVLSWEETGQDLGGGAVLVADNPDRGGDFESDVEDVRASYLSGRATTVLKVSELGAGTRAAILGAFDEGASLMSYVGHGGTTVWASENVLNDWDVPSLRAQSRQPLLLTLNCLNGYFVTPNLDALPEALLKAEGRGVMAAFSPSGLSLDGPAHEYHRAVMAELASAEHERLGDVILAAQRSYAETGLMPELLDVYQLLGDPAISIHHH